jgi:hypothetical protein
MQCAIVHNIKTTTTSSYIDESITHKMVVSYENVSQNDITIYFLFFPNKTLNIMVNPAAKILLKIYILKVMNLVVNIKTSIFLFLPNKTLSINDESSSHGIFFVFS